MPLPTVASRTLRRAAKRRRAASSVAPVASGYERGRAGLDQHEFHHGTRATPACFSQTERTICNGGEL